MVRAIRAKLPLFANLLAILFGMVSILVFTWFFDYIEELYIKIPTTALAMSLPIPVLFAKVRPIYEMDKAKNALFWMSLPASLFLVAVVNTYLERVLSSIPLPILMNTTFAFISACGTWFYWKIAVRQHLLVATAVLTVGVAFMSLVFLLSKSGLEFELVLLPLPFVMFAGIPWIVATRWSWERAGHTRHRPLMGLFMESLTMFLVVVPLTVIAILAVRVITDEPIWVAVAGIVIALLFSSAISEPFGKFLRALGGLDENRRGPDS